jgi:hypothetical protein
MIRHFLLLSLLILFTAVPPSLIASDASIVEAVRAKGAEVTETKGEVVAVAFKNNTGLSPADYAPLHKLPHLKSLSCGIGIDDAALKALAGLPALETFSTNGMAATDEGMASLASIKTLTSIAFFHPGKKFTGTGLAALVNLPKLERLTVAGSAEFADEGMAAVAKLTQLREFRTWHSGVTIEGVRKLRTLKDVRSIMLGQRLAYTPPACVSDEAVAVLAGMKSLEMLSVSEARLSLPALKGLKQLPKLKRLTLDGIEMSEADLAALRQQLSQVDVKWTAPSEAAVKRIKGIFPQAKP